MLEYERILEYIILNVNINICWQNRIHEYTSCMKTYKFRAWNTKNKEWIPTYQLLMNAEWKLCCCYSDKTHWEWAIDYEVNLSTWLQDKNGKEIYDWDVVIWNTSYERDSDEYVWTREKPAYVNWIDAQAWFYPFTLWNRWRCDVCNIEVIWNIHENPELLNK